MVLGQLYATCHEQESRHKKYLETLSGYSILVQFEARSTKRTAILTNKIKVISLRHALLAEFFEKAICMKTKDQLYQRESVILRPSGGKTSHERRFGMPFYGPVIPSGAMVEYHPIFCERPILTASVWSKSLVNFSVMHYTRRNLERRHFVADIEELEEMDAIGTPRLKAQCKGSVYIHEW